jgi:uncharacterized protein DUF6510
VLDGNAAAGLLQQIFAVGVTRASIICVACESVQPLASLRLFGLPMGYILSCPQCHATPESWRIDFVHDALLTVSVFGCSLSPHLFRTNARQSQPV